MREPFNPIPSGGVGLSKGYLERLQRAASRGSGSADMMGSAGTGYDSSLGQIFAPETGSDATTTTTDVEIIRIQGNFIKDDAGQTTCGGSPSPLCYYPGVIQKLTCAGWDAKGGDDLVWVVFWYTYASVDNSPNPATVVGVDGTGAHMAKSMGFSYAPTDAESELEYNGDERPVYGSTEYAAAWAIQCVDGSDEATLGG